jgi:hypothetical protein
LRHLQLLGAGKAALGKLKDAVARRARDVVVEFCLPWWAGAEQAPPPYTQHSNNNHNASIAAAAAAAAAAARDRDANDADDDIARLFLAHQLGVSVALASNLCAVHAALPSPSLRAAVWSELVAKQVACARHTLAALSRRADDTFAAAGGSEKAAACFAELEACVRSVRSVLRALPEAWLEDQELVAGVLTSRGRVVPAMLPLLDHVDGLAKLLQRMANEGVYRVKTSAGGAFGGLQQDVTRLSWGLSQATAHVLRSSSRTAGSE